jgi:hypothetical protein
MPQTQPRLLAADAIVEENATMTQVFRTFTQQVSQAVVIVGLDDPEGVLEAPQYSRYIDETDPLIPVQYLKMLPDIAGERTEGWVLV